MKTIKVIDLLNKIANEEEVPNKIKFDGEIWEKAEGGKNKVYYTNDVDDDLFIIILRNNCTYSINDEVEIIEEEKEIEKLDENNTNVLTNIIENRKKINELIDAVNELKRGN